MTLGSASEPVKVAYIPNRTKFLKMNCLNHCTAPVKLKCLTMYK